MRKNIYDVLKNGDIDIKKEYSRIFDLFFAIPFAVAYCDDMTLEEIVDKFFSKLNIKLIGRFIILCT